MADEATHKQYVGRKAIVNSLKRARKEGFMKHFKKVITLLLSAMMILAMGATAFAEDTAPAYDHPLTVTGLGTGDTVKFYQVIEWVGNASGNVAGWKAVPQYARVLTEAKLKEILVGTKADPTATPPVEAKDPTGITSEIAGQLAKLAGEDGEAGTVSGATATYNNTEAGMWMALVTPADANTVYNPVFVSADYNKDAGGSVGMGDQYNGDAVAKKSTLSLTKTAATSEDSWDDGKSSTTAVGDTVNFTVTTTIPGYGDVYTSPHFVMKDKLTALKLNKDSVTVTGLRKGTDYTVDAQDDGYTITFTETYLKGLKAATDITVTYSAVVTSTAANAVNEEDNEVSIEYSHNPNQQSDYDVKKDTTQHYTFSLDAEGAGQGTSVSGKKTSELVKVGVDANGDPITEVTKTSEITSTETWESPLAGAVFGLFTDKDGTVPLKDKDGNDVTATTGADGRMNFAGLDAGTYYLKEISAPAGFVTDPNPHTVVITAATKSVKVTEWWNGTEWVSTKPTSGTAKEVTYDTDILESYKVTVDGNTAAEYKFKNPATANSTDINWEEAEMVEHPFEIENKQGTELPSTGGIGTIIFYTLGTILVVGCGIVLVSRRRMQKNK